jgi:hypothetical protein
VVGVSVFSSPSVVVVSVSRPSSPSLGVVAPSVPVVSVVVVAVSVLLVVGVVVGGAAAAPSVPLVEISTSHHSRLENTAVLPLYFGVLLLLFSKSLGKVYYF